jgi:hypothetical protein
MSDIVFSYHHSSFHLCHVSSQIVVFHLGGRSLLG